MTAATAVVACGVLALVTVIAANLVDTPKTKARAGVEARSYELRPTRRRVPRSATFIIQARHIVDPVSAESTVGSDVDETVLILDAGLVARSEAA